MDDTVPVRTQGGMVGLEMETVSGEAKLNKGRKYLLFLRKSHSEEKHYCVTGGYQGAFKDIGKGPAGEEIWLRQSGTTIPHEASFQEMVDISNKINSEFIIDENSIEN